MVSFVARMMRRDKNKNVHEEEEGKKREDWDHYAVVEDRKLWDA